MSEEQTEALLKVIRGKKKKEAEEQRRVVIQIPSDQGLVLTTREEPSLERREVVNVRGLSTANPLDVLYAQRLTAMLNFDETLGRLRHAKSRQDIRTLLVVDTYCRLISNIEYRQRILAMVKNSMIPFEDIAREIGRSYLRDELEGTEHDELFYVTMVEKTLKRVEIDMLGLEARVGEGEDVFDELRELGRVVESCEVQLKYNTPDAMYDALKRRMAWYRAKVFSLEAEGYSPDAPQNPLLNIKDIIK